MSKFIVDCTVEINGYTMATGHRGKKYEVAVYYGKVGDSIGRGVPEQDLDLVETFYDIHNGTVHARNFILTV